MSCQKPPGRQGGRQSLRQASLFPRKSHYRSMGREIVLVGVMRCFCLLQLDCEALMDVATDRGSAKLYPRGDQSQAMRSQHRGQCRYGQHVTLEISTASCCGSGSSMEESVVNGEGLLYCFVFT